MVVRDCHVGGAGVQVFELLLKATQLLTQLLEGVLHVLICPVLQHKQNTVVRQAK